MKFLFVADPVEPDNRRRGWASPTTERPRAGRFVVDDEPMRFRIDERRERHDHKPTEDEIRRRKKGEFVYVPAWDYSPTGELRVHLTDLGGNVFVTRKDGVRKKLEYQITQVLHDLVDRAEAVKRRREEDRIAEEERRYQERLAREQSGRRATQAELVAELERQAGAWARARMLGRYVRAARRALEPGQTLHVKVANLEVDFLAWAEGYISQMDPLSPAPRNPDQRPNESTYYGSHEEDARKAMHRLFSHSWPKAMKLLVVDNSMNDD